jgi:hypothetical protein
MAIQVAQVPQAWRNRGVAHQSPYQGRRATIGLDAFTGGKSGANPAGAGTLASRQIISPDVVGTSDEDMQDAVSTETQQVIPNQTTAPTFRIGNEANGHIGIGDVLSSRANPNFDSSKAIGGANVPMQPTSGIGGWFRSAFGDKANEQNLAAQQAQGQQWANDAKENRAFDRQKELFGMQAEENAKRDTAHQAIQDSKDASYETRYADALAAAQAKGINDDLQRMDLAVVNNTSRENIAAGNATSRENIAELSNEGRRAVAELNANGRRDVADALILGRITVADANNIAKSSVVDRQIAGSMDRVAAESASRQAIAAGKNDTGMAIQKLRNLGIAPKAGSLINPELFGGKTPYMFSPANPFTHSAGGFGPVDSAEQMGGQLKGPGNSAAQRPGTKAAQQFQLERAQEGAQLEATPEELAMWLKMKREKGGK